MTMEVKICGLSTPETLDAAIAGGARHIGFVFFSPSPRNVTPEQAGALAERVAGRAKIIGLFVDPEPDFINAIRTHVPLDIIQLHGNERPALASRIGMVNGLEVWKAVPVRNRTDLAVAEQYRGAAQRILYDAKPPKGADLPGGNGLRFDWNLLQGHKHSLPWALSGGLDPSNLAEAARITGATLLDVSSGVESTPGIKDVDKIAAFLKAASIL
ncbi:MAG: phosphoribosylanthranilate isomerase [Pseudomonadota bacterium]